MKRAEIEGEERLERLRKTRKGEKNEVSYRGGADVAVKKHWIMTIRTGPTTVIEEGSEAVAVPVAPVMPGLQR